MNEELEKLRKELSIREELESLKEENRLLKEKIRDYEVILSIGNTDTDTIVCEHQRLDNIAYYCDKMMIICVILFAVRIRIVLGWIRLFR